MGEVLEKEELPRELLALIDGDEILYKVGFSSQHMWYYIYEGNTYICKFLYQKQAKAFCKNNSFYYIQKLEVSEEKEAIDNLHLTMDTIFKDIGTDKCRIFLNGEINFRDQLATLQPYKGNRDDSKKPIHYNLIKGLLIDEYFAEIVEGYESDDAMAIHQNENTIIVTQDKDLDMVPGYRYSTSKREIYKISEVEAMRSFYGQLVMGDRSDNIPGIAGIGKVTAKKLFEKCVDDLSCFAIAANEYVGAFQKLDKNPLFKDRSLVEIMLEIGNLLWMLRSNEDRWEFPTLDKSTWRFNVI